jgi:hypothetical protein
VRALACPLHRDMLELDPLAKSARRPLTEAELGAGDQWRLAKARRQPRKE